MLEPDVGGAISSALATGEMGGLDDLLTDVGEEAKIAGATGGDMHVELDALADFYNALSSVYQDLQAQYKQMAAQMTAMSSVKVGGQVAGVQAAWKAMVEAAGTGRNGSSLLGNIESVANLIGTHMANLQQVAQGYAAQENMNLVGIGKASNAGTTGTAGTAPAAPVTTAATHGQSY